MEHRDDRQDVVGIRDPGRECRQSRVGVQPDRAVRVQHPLGASGRAGRVAQRRRLVLVSNEVDEVDLGGSADELLVVDDAGVVRDVGLRSVVHDDHVAHGRQAWQHPAEQRHQRPVDEQRLVLGVVHRVHDLLRVVPDVHRVKDVSGARYREVQGQVTRGVPREGADAGVRGQPERLERAGDAAGLGSRSRQLSCARFPPRCGWRLAAYPSRSRRAGRSCWW